MIIDNCTKDDYDYIISNVIDFWGSDRTLHLHHPILLYEFGNTAFVVREKEAVCGYLFGFYSQMEPCAYIHLTAVHHMYRRKSIGKSLYSHFVEKARTKNCTHMKAITGLTNKDSITFHKAIGFDLLGDADSIEHKCVKNYSGPGEDRIVFLKKI